VIHARETTFKGDGGDKFLKNVFFYRTSSLRAMISTERPINNISPMEHLLEKTITFQIWAALSLKTRNRNNTQGIQKMTSNDLENAQFV
jgi:hypothetical protein